MKMMKSVLMMIVGLMLLSCGSSPNSPNIRQLTGVEKQLVQSDNKFGFKLFDKIVQAEGEKNLFISPLSVSMALGMTLNGADGETYSAMQQTLEFAGMSEADINLAYRSLIDLLAQLDPEVVFNIANSIWMREGMQFEQDFLDRNQTYFDATIRALDFSNPGSVDIINGWVSDNTNGKIETIIDEIDPAVVMFLINAIYFNGTWTFEFDEELTRDDQFTLSDGSQTNCKMMMQTSRFRYFENEDLQIIDLPYGGRQFSMTILLPRGDRDIDAVITGLDDRMWETLMQNLAPDSVIVQLPKFKVEYEIGLNDVLSALGMGVAFTPAADFTRMFEPGGLWIDYVKHKTFVEVDEEGTEAAAVTVVAIIESSGGPPPKPLMRIDRPFLFVIREHHSGTILFMGKIVEPVL